MNQYYFCIFEMHLRDAAYLLAYSENVYVISVNQTINF